MDVSRYVLPTGSYAPDGTTNAYLLGTDSTMLVDPAARTDELDRAVADRSVDHVLVTHTHPDHVGAVDAYADETDATVWARYGRTDRFREATGRHPDRTFTPGTHVRVGDESVRVLGTPGHAPDHVGLEAGRDGPICCGDVAVREGSVVVGAPEGDMRAYLTSLRRLYAIDPPVLHPGHGEVIDAPRATLERLVQHRYRRERRVLEAVMAGDRTLPAILERAYEKELTGVRELAAATVRAHLEKLAVEDRLVWDGERATPS